MDSVAISFQVRSTGPDLRLRAWLDDIECSDIKLTDHFQTFVHEFCDDDRDHVFEIELTGKKIEHTLVDSHGQILEDRVVEIRQVQLDGIDLGQLLYDKTTYTHDHNGTSDIIIDKFFGTMGCNGRVRLAFTSPIYLWLLENL